MTQRETKNKMLVFHNIFGFSGKSIFKFKVDLFHKGSKKVLEDLKLFLDSFQFFYYF